MADDPAAAPRANDSERRRWNDERRTASWPERERLTSLVTVHLLQAMGLRRGERALDVGCGGGRTTIASAEAVGPDGYVVGADVSIALVELARRRAKDARAANVSFVVADVQTDHLDGGPFDVAASQFGVMFFDEPVTAFANIRAHLRPAGRLAFVCWQSVGRNPWFIGTALGPFIPPAPAPAAGKSPTGPFSLGDTDHTSAVLEAAGYAQVHHASYEINTEAPASAIVDDSQLELMGVPKSMLADARTAVVDHLARFRIGVDLYRFPLAFFVFSAVNR